MDEPVGSGFRAAARPEPLDGLTSGALALADDASETAVLIASEEVDQFLASVDTSAVDVRLGGCILRAADDRAFSTPC
ncbi:hypothetical protein ACFUIY_09345 [Streptomyces griseorubiginosus]|uniref:hypothetical protein n=1 Tax=Streptomyces griseorubiginosus TaxID=67304 RepID=UPI00114072D5|nr:hypothetical protein [Streptomyces griseorubiginosus]